jgi:hypothetical protein
MARAQKSRRLGCKRGSMGSRGSVVGCSMRWQSGFGLLAIGGWSFGTAGIGGWS